MMHDTAYHIGSLAMSIYADLRDASVLEIGSQSVNGSLRDHVLPTTRYVGIDIEEGEGVDLVLSPGQPLPVEDGTFDLVMASSVFEHDPCFWITFLEMCRATNEGGYIYINAPSNGIVHRYPQDNWRFYPDSGKALVQWAVSQGHSVRLVESFIANRENDIWNDFVAVFRKGGEGKTLPKIFVHESVPCANIWTWKSEELGRPSNAPEDMLLLLEAKERAQAADSLVAEATEERDHLASEIAKISEELAGVSVERDRFAETNGRLEAEIAEVNANAKRQIAEFETEVAGAHKEVELRASELRQRQAEIEQMYSELAQARSACDTFRSRTVELELAVERLGNERAEIERQFSVKQLELEEGFSLERAEWTEQLNALKNELEAVRTEFADRLGRAEVDAREAEAELERSAGKILALTLVVLQQEALRRSEAERTEWLRQIGEALQSLPNWWRLLPSRWRKRKERDLLLRRGLFDGHAYLHQNPDVSGARIDALHHYLAHGMIEGRSRPN